MVKSTKKITKKLIREVNVKANFTVGALKDITLQEFYMFMSNNDIHEAIKLGFSVKSLMEYMKEKAIDCRLENTDEFFNVSGFIEYIKFLRGVENE